MLVSLPLTIRPLKQRAPADADLPRNPMPREGYERGMCLPEEFMHPNNLTDQEETEAQTMRSQQWAGQRLRTAQTCVALVLYLNFQHGSGPQRWTWGRVEPLDLCLSSLIWPH